LGIGLPLASGLAKANGARIEIDSAPGEGTAVALIFPKDRLAA
jgi:signal transduction histidine kinase